MMQDIKEEFNKDIEVLKKKSNWNSGNESLKSNLKTQLKTLPIGPSRRQNIKAESWT
jgi:hypothetical protein